MKADKEFIIPFIGLKLGSHSFEFEVKDSFFESLDYSLIHKGEAKVTLELDKKETMLIAKFKAVGIVSTDCDRCNTPMDVSVKGEFQLVYKFGFEESEDESLVVLHPDDFEINVKDPIYELLTISLPVRKIHPEGECDEEMMKLLSQYTINVNDPESDEDWDDEEWDDDFEDFDDDEDEDDEIE
jgi:uncharacterized metal-binding protein YceD (DUF177 family)